MTGLNDRLLDWLNTHYPATRYTRPPERMEGGYDTEVYRFGIKGANLPPGAFVLRKFPKPDDSGRAYVEASVQESLHESGFPAPAVMLVCADPSILGTPFFVMEYIEGNPLASVPPDVGIRMMGDTLARLHLIDTSLVVTSLADRGLDNCRLDDRLRSLSSFSSGRQWLAEPVEWLTTHRPQRSRVVACHGDFHPFNVLVNAEANVSGVIDWSNFSLMDPAFDIATTLISLEVIARHLAPPGSAPLPGTDGLLKAYSAHRAFDDVYLDYYRALRATIMLALAADGVEVFRHPGIVRDLALLIRTTTSIRVLPDWG